MIVDRHRPCESVVDHAISIDGVHKAYRRGTTCSTVLDGVDVKVRRGECVFLAGPSGSGKTTLLSIIGCILSADRGRVSVLGHDTGELRPDQLTALRRTQIGFVFQRFHLIRGLTALENAGVPLTLRGVPPRKIRKAAAQLLDAVGLAEKQKDFPSNMSAGECQRLALARALVGDPDLILADEPTASLDADNGQRVMGLLRRLTSENGKTTIVVTHDHRIFSFADRILFLENGRVAEQSQAEDTFNPNHKQD